VLGTYVLLESALRVAAKAAPGLREAIAADRQRRSATVPLAWDIDPKKPHETIEYKAIETRVVPSEISGEMRVEYNGKPVSAQVPYQQQNRVSSGIARPKAYWVPAAWPEVIERLQLHGIALERIEEARELPVTMYRLEEAKFESEAFEGRVRVNAKPVPEKRMERFAPGSVRVTTDQPLGHLAAVLLEPASPDSFFQWGFFNEVLQQTEYIEPYVIEPMAERLMKENPKLAEEFRARVEKDEAFRSSAKERLRWFYQRTVFGDERWKLYPVGREE
jgi:hypothetical protein